MAFASVFTETWDVAVVGGGCAGLAAAWTATAAGARTILVTADGDLAVEPARQLLAAGGSDGGPWWQAWRERLAGCGKTQPAGGEGGVTPPGQRASFDFPRENSDSRSPLGEAKAAGEAAWDGALAELAAHALVAGRSGLRWLGYSPVVGLERDGDLASALILATKAGLRRLRCRRIIDANAGGVVARLAGAAAPPTPSAWRLRLVVVGEAWPDTLPLPVVPGLACAWDPLLPWPEQRRLLLSCPDRERLVAAQADAITALRAVLPTACQGNPLAITAAWPEPVHRHAPAPAGLPANLALAVPAWADSAGEDIAALCRLGSAAGTRIAAAPAATTWSATEPRAAAPGRQLSAGVLVAGAGTAGADAAIAAASAGVDVLCVDPLPWPGGMATAGMVIGYCAGASGGLQTALDAELATLTAACGERRRIHGWQPAAKAATLSAAFARSGVRFLPGATVYAVQRDGERVTAVDVATADGPLRIQVQSAIDASGDGDLCVLAGCAWSGGRSGDGGTLAFTQSVYLAERKADGWHVRSTNFDCGWVDACDSEDLTRARAHGLALVASHVGPDLRPLMSAPALGLRQSRHIATDAVVEVDDLVRHRRHPDAVGTTRSFFDTHASDIHAEDAAGVCWLWICRSFRGDLSGDLPYRMLLPRGLANVWVAGRCAGIAADAAYALRMMRDLRRLGEAAGTAAALASRGDGTSRGIDLRQLQERMRASGALPADTASEAEDATLIAAGLAALDAGNACTDLWHLWRRIDACRAAVADRLAASDPQVSWLAAAILGLAGDARAEPHLIAAISSREEGAAPGTAAVGAHGQRIVVPNWVAAIAVLRTCGSARCLPALAGIADGRCAFDLRLLIALTAEQLAGRLGIAEAARLGAICGRLLDHPADDARLPPSRSMARRLAGLADPPLHNQETPVLEDLQWQLQLAVARTRRVLRLDADALITALAADERGHVRREALRLRATTLA